LWTTLRPQWNLPSQQDPIGWNAAAKDDRTIQIPNITIHAHSMCGELSSQRADGKLSGKNPGWGDGMGGGRFK
jgi:hypothetical protein